MALPGVVAFTPCYCVLSPILVGPGFIRMLCFNSLSRGMPERDPDAHKVNFTAHCQRRPMPPDAALLSFILTVIRGHDAQSVVFFLGVAPIREQSSQVRGKDPFEV